jgi:uncharacterized protein YutE (UPF0331/DUF86 family)
MFEKDAILSKISGIKRCMETIKKATGFRQESLDDILIQDVFILNMQRIIQACIDMANIIIASHGWKLPSTYKESFAILRENLVISSASADILMKMCGFRNIAVHDYQQITPSIMKTIMTHHLRDFEEYYSIIYAYVNKQDFSAAR